MKPHSTHTRIVFVALIFAGLQVASARPSFTDITDEAGIRFVHVDGRSGRKYFMETLGSGAAFFDYDNDGDPDLYLVNGAPLPGYTGDPRPINHLYENLGEGRFRDVTDRARVGDVGYGHGVAVGDYDGDSDLDLYVTNDGPNVLYRNNGDGTFTDVTDVAGVAEPRWSTSATFADVDGDGDLDLYVANYIEFDIDENPWCGLREEGVRAYCEPDQFPGQRDALYRNNGDGTFTDVSDEAGIANPRGKGLGVAWADYDNDGDLDLYVANDSTENFLYRNNGDGTFSEIGLMAGVALSENGAMENGMGTAWGDFNGDGWLDLTVTNYANQMNTLYANDGDGFFSDVSAASRTGRVTYPFLAWATAFFDVDNDGDLDLFVANGHLHDNLQALHQEGSYAQRNLLFLNRGDQTFEEVGEQLGDGMQLVEVSRGAAIADIDLDGDLDMVVTNSHGRARLLRNDGGNTGNWLEVRLVRRRGSPDAIGARIVVEADGRSQMREVASGSGYLSQNELRQHFGLGQSRVVERLTVRWAKGSSTELADIPANRRIVVTEGGGWETE